MKFITFVLAIIICNTSLSQEKVLRVAIIGAGTAGISAAYHVNQIDPNADITLYEKEHQLGGNALSVPFKNKGKDVLIDLGPQYIAEGPWDEYIEFLENNNEYNNISKFSGSFIIESEEAREFLSPKDGKKRGESVENLLAFKKFYSAARKVYKNPESTETLSVGEWLKTLEVDDQFKTNVILPFLSASLGVSVQQIHKIDIREIVKLFAFQNAFKKSEFIVFNNGLGTVVTNIAESLMKKGITVKSSTEIMGIMDNTYYYTVQTVEGEEETFDYIIVAIHPDQAAQLFNADEKLLQISDLLYNFPYFSTSIAIHRDSSLVNNASPSFLNIKTNSANEVMASTMNLGVINPEWCGLYKSWLSNEEIERIEGEGKLLHVQQFMHPLITPKYSKALNELQMLQKQYPSLSVIGGWTKGMETQETALKSGKEAAEKYWKFYQSKLD